MRPASVGERTTSMPVFFDVAKSWSRSGSGTSSMEPLIVRDELTLRCAATDSRLGRAGFACAPPSGEKTLRMLVPMRRRSPSFRRARLIFSPLTKVPLVDPRSSMTRSSWS